MAKHHQIPAPLALHFFLGGYDLEMLTIRELLQHHAPGGFSDAGLGWGARASSYAEAIRRVLSSGRTPVLVELVPDLDLPAEAAILVDHHGRRAGAEAATSLEQVFALLRLPPEHWTRWMALVAANDRGWIPAMQALGASAEEIRRVRALDREAQGVTPADEAAAERAARALERLAGGRLTLARLDTDRVSPLADRLAPELGGEGYANLLVISPGEANFFGEGRLVRLLDAHFPGGWYGGALPERGFWGHALPLGGAVADSQVALLNTLMSQCRVEMRCAHP
jgi:hypothetical protein